MSAEARIMPDAQVPTTTEFYTAVPTFDGFPRVTDPSLYHPLPEDWLVGTTDVVQSGAAITAGRYKAVNMAGAAVISAMANALGSYSYPFVFGGDGASFAVGAAETEIAREALARTAGWVREELGLSLRAALIPVADIRAEGHDVRLARFGVSSQVSYAMFSGGGMAHAEQILKAGRYAVPPAEPDRRPNLSGLSCRWEQVPAMHGLVLSLVVVPANPERSAEFDTLIGDVLAMVADPSQADRPRPSLRRSITWPPSGLDLEARASRRAGESLLKRRLLLTGRTLLSWLIFRFGLKAGGFDPAIYCRDLVENADFRKYGDGLRMTLDCSPALADRLEAHLRRAADHNIVRYGVHRQDAALVTCLLPSVFGRDHIHFLDGAAGGYAEAARQMKDASAAHVYPTGGSEILEPR